MTISDLYKPLSDMLIARQKISCPPYQFCTVNRKIICCPMNHQQKDLTSIYKVSSTACLHGLTSKEWNELISRVFENMERNDLCLDSLKP